MEKENEVTQFLRSGSVGSAPGTGEAVRPEKLKDVATGAGRWAV